MEDHDTNQDQSASERTTHLWPPGRSQNPAGRESKAARRARARQLVEAWAEPWGGSAALTPVARTLAMTAAEVFLSNPKSAEDISRRANSIARLLQQAGLAGGRPR
jgi:hypothetical protein